MRCAILQPSYIPWRGYFDIIRKVDLFIFYDDVQYDRRGWRNRNRIKTRHGTRWLTIPVHAKGAQIASTPIRQIETVDDSWAAEHLNLLVTSYQKSPHFSEYYDWIRGVYARPPRLLSEFTIDLTMQIARLLGIEKTRFMRSSELKSSGVKTERLLSILQQVNASHYVSGPAARDYLDEPMMNASGVSVEWMMYEYPEYPQLYPPYDPRVSVLDLLFMTGERAPDFIWVD